MEILPALRAARQPTNDPTAQRTEIRLGLDQELLIRVVRAATQEFGLFADFNAFLDVSIHRINALLRARVAGPDCGCQDGATRRRWYDDAARHLDEEAELAMVWPPR